MTTTSSDNGAPAADGDGEDTGGRGWFTPAADQRGVPETAATGAPPAPDGGRPSVLPRQPIRPVGSSAARSRTAPPAASGPGPASAEGPPPPAASGFAAHPGAPGQPGAAPGTRGGEPEPVHERLAPRPGGQAPPPGSAPASGGASAGAPGAPPVASGAPPAGGVGQTVPEAPGGPLGAGGASLPGGPVASVREPSRDALLIRRTMQEVEPVAHAVTAYFYALLFVEHPHLRDLFPASMDAQRDRLFRALLTAVQLIDEKDRLHEYLAGLGRGHRKYGTRSDHYPAVGECLIGALTQYAPNSWDAETENAWVRAYTEISQIMIDSAAEDEMRSPAWWNAEIVAHERRTPHIAVISVRPDQPYPFRAGQYTSIETPWWPRVWRHYSFASPPRSDGLLTFHVKAVAAGWVSTALVQRARPGDVLRLGPAAGSMTVDHSADSGLVCLGGGTGIAPIRALVQDVVEHARPRPVEVFFGVRHDEDLYDLETLRELAARNSWLTVRSVVALGTREPGPHVISGELTDAVRQFGPWPTCDGYLSGPPGMVRGGMDVLVASGIPAHRIRHDSIEELVVTGD
ncbi:flavohemoprotein [Streptomyces sp. AJS327]|uniref:globin domain-containing protein n=1 Tax=Streptomyces sp. AJS327 TaxID=2545265 RepID=UPI0015E04828|nr:globin domain-containing protein [Streptomyces sp. AJS327]MBA0052860.1 flavohemoprotein [Streptomyces sp. AJS327]